MDGNRDLYQWDGGDQCVSQGGGCTDTRVTTRFRDEIYDQRTTQWCQPSDRGTIVNNIIVYGDLYMDQSNGGQRIRTDGRCEYYGNQYDYRGYCQPRAQTVPYYEYGYRVYNNGGCWTNQQQYDRSCYQDWNYGYQQGRPQVYYDYSYNQGGSYRAPTYSRDRVQGGRDGYSADRERYNGGGGSWGGGGGYDNGWDQAGQVFDFALRGFDSWAGYDIARRHANGQYRNNGGNQGGYGERRNMRHYYGR